MSIVLTRTQNIRPSSNLDKYEIRGSRYGVLDAFLRDTNAPGSVVSEDLKAKYFASIGSVVQVPVIDYDGGISIGSSRSVTISDSENTSAFQTVTSTTYSFGFTMVPSLYHNNEIGYQRDFEAKFWKYAYLFLATIDSACASALDTYKTQTFNDILVYSEANDTINVTLAQESRVMGDISVITEANDFFSPLAVIGNGGLQSLALRLQQNGLYNAENRVLQFQDKTLHFSNRIANAEGQGATFYAVNQGSVGIISRVDREALRGTKSKAAGREWGVINFPMLDLPVGTMYYESDGDFNAIAGAASADMTAAHKEHFGFSVDIAIVTAYNSDITTRANPITKFQIAAS